MNCNILYCLFIIVFSIEASAQKKINQSSTLAVNDQKVISQVINDFLKWYGNQYLNIYKLKLINKDSSGNYSVDLKQCEQYLQILKSSGFISDEYIRLWRQYFESKANSFRINIQNEGPPEGFDYDFILHTQEVEDILVNSTKFKHIFIESKFNESVVEVHTHRKEITYEFELRLVNGKWLIDYISQQEPK